MRSGLLVLCGGLAALVIAAAMNGAGAMTIVLIALFGAVMLAMLGRSAAFSAGLSIDNESCADGGGD
jgi:hypothetical protein